ncbi:MAG: hypothetical protein ACFFER_19335 [Candidatus Thorarchaeota archaeon]
MRRLLQCATAIFLIFALAMPSIYTSDGVQITANKDFSLSEVTITEMNPNFELIDQPTLLENGNSGEFTAFHSSTEQFGDYGFVQLTWTHTFGTELNTSDEQMDYAGCSMNFDWPYEELPRNIRPYIEYTISKSGDFVNSPEDQYAHLMTYLIDSSQNRIPISANYLGSGFYGGSPDVSPQDIEDAFGGMVENTEGVQEDPTDTLTVAIILEPFEHFFDPNCEGSVDVFLHKLSIDIVRAASPNEPILTPGRQVTWRTAPGNIEGDIADYDSVNDYALNLVMAANGSIYGLVQSSAQNHISAVVLKWNEQMQLLWSYRIYDIYVETGAMAVSNDAIYVAGYTLPYEDASDIVLAKLDLQGVLQWSETYDFGDQDSCRSVAANDDGSLYVFVNNPASGYWNASLVKIGQGGEVQWARILPMVFGSHVACSKNGRIYTLGGDRLIEWDSAGNTLWNRTDIRMMTLGPEGTIFGTMMERTTDGGYALRLTKLEGGGSQIWNTTYRVHYSYNRNETILPYSQAVCRNGSVFVSVYLDGFALETRLLHFNGNTSAFIESRLLTEDSKPDFATGYLAGGVDGYLYRFRSLEGDVMLYAFAPPVSGFFGLPLSAEILILVGGFAVVVVLAIVLVRRRR